MEHVAVLQKLALLVTELHTHLAQELKKLCAGQSGPHNITKFSSPCWAGFPVLGGASALTQPLCSRLQHLSPTRCWLPSRVGAKSIGGTQLTGP